jgi:hypothetical protein
MSVEITTRILNRLPDDVFTKETPTTEEEFNLPNGSFEIAGATDDKAEDWARTTNNATAFEADTSTQGRLGITLSDPEEDDPLYPILKGGHAYVLGEKSDAKPSRSVSTGDYVQIQSSLYFDRKNFTDVAFRFAYISETDWTDPGEWRGQLLVDGVVVWFVDLYNGAIVYNSNQEVSLDSVSPGFHTLEFRLIYLGAGYNDPLPTFLLDDIRFVKRETSSPTILWAVLSAIAEEFGRIDEADATVKALLHFATATSEDLDLLGAGFGVPRPYSLGISDAQYRNLIRICIVEPKTTNKTLSDAIEILTGFPPVSMTEEASFVPSAGVPPVLRIELAGGGLVPAISGTGITTDLWFYG